MQHSQPSFSPQILSLVIAKFSHTTTPIHHAGPLTWNHVNGNADLYCVFEKFINTSPVPSSLIQKVMRGDEILEQVDLVYLVRTLTMLAQLIPPPKSHFAVVVKSPCIAVKYLYRDSYIRRFQIKFNTEHDYLMALSLLGEINCPLIEGNPPVPAARLSSASSWTSGNLSVVPGAIHATTSHGGNRAHLGMGAIGSGGTTPIRASSPASTVSYPPGGFVNRLPMRNQPTLGMEQTAVNQSLYGSKPLTAFSHDNQEAPSSQLSTVSAIHDAEQLNQMLPPKRDLPFSKPATKKPPSTEVTITAQKHEEVPIAISQSNRPGRDTEDALQKPAIDFDRSPACSQSQSQTLSQFGTLPQPRQPLPSYDQSPVSSQVTRAKGLNVNKYEELDSQKDQHACHQLNDLNTATKPDDKQEQEPAPCAPPAITEDQLAEYLAHPNAERIAYLENWMCELIEDDKFMALCQDVECTWRRFAFGRRQ